MNTPAPCDSCRLLCYNVMEEDNPLASAWCDLELPIGRADCPRYEKDSRTSSPVPLTAEQVWERMRDLERRITPAPSPLARCLGRPSMAKNDGSGRSTAKNLGDWREAVANMKEEIGAALGLGVEALCNQAAEQVWKRMCPMCYVRDFGTCNYYAAETGYGQVPAFSSCPLLNEARDA